MTDLCSLQDLKDWLATGSGAFPPTDDALLARSISAASAFIESWLSRPIGLAGWQEVRNGTGQRRMQLWATPIKSILGVAIRDGNSLLSIPPLPGSGTILILPNPTQPQIVPTFTGPNYAFGYTFTLTELCLWGQCLPMGSQNIIVQYTAGYDPVPADIQQACIELIARKYRERSRIGERSRSIGGIETVGYWAPTSFSMKDMSTDAQVALQQYRQVSPLLPAMQLPPPPPPPLVLEDATTVIELEDQVTPITSEGTS